MNIVYRIFELKELWIPVSQYADEVLATCFEDWGKEFTTEEEASYFIRRTILDSPQIMETRELIIQKVIRI
jgi:hypothetical protein